MNKKQFYNHIKITIAFILLVFILVFLKKDDIKIINDQEEVQLLGAITSVGGHEYEYVVNGEWRQIDIFEEIGGEPMRRTGFIMCPESEATEGEYQLDENDELVWIPGFPCHQDMIDLFDSDTSAIEEFVDLLVENPSTAYTEFVESITWVDYFN